MDWRERLLTSFGPGVLGGITFGQWFRLLRDERFAVHPSCLPRALAITTQSLKNSVVRIYEQRRYGPLLRNVGIEPPIFVLGHWRNGTTHLHQLLAHDRRFAFPNGYQVTFPHTFLTAETLDARWMSRCLPKRRPMENMEWSLASPQEDEFALCASCLKSPSTAWAFPARRHHYSRYLTFRNATAQDIAEWRAAFELRLHGRMAHPPPLMRVYALRGSPGPGRSAWPMFRRTSRHLGNAAEMGFANLSRWANGIVDLEISASPAVSSASLETSADLSTWASIGTVSLVNGSGGFQDGGAVGQARRFYRASNGGFRTFSPAGYIELSLGTGFTMGAIQVNGTNSTVRSIFAGVPNSTTIQKYNPATASYETATFSSGAWSGVNFRLLPGDGALVNNNSGGSFTITLTGEVLQRFLTASVPATLSVRASMIPQSGDAMALLGLTPVLWDQVQRYNRNSSSYDVFTFVPGDVWSPSTPQPAAGESFWFDTGTARVAQRTFLVWP